MPTKLINLAEALIQSFYSGEKHLDYDTALEMRTLTEDEREAVMAIVYAEIHGE